MKKYPKILGRLYMLFICFIMPISLLAAPIIEVDSPNVNLGSIREGKIKKIRHTFKIKNTGDKPLIIHRVKPG